MNFGILLKKFVFNVSDERAMPVCLCNVSVLVCPSESFLTSDNTKVRKKGGPGKSQNPENGHVG